MDADCLEDEGVISKALRSLFVIYGPILTDCVWLQGMSVGTWIFILIVCGLWCACASGVCGESGQLIAWVVCIAANDS